MTELKKYQYATAVLGVIVLVLGILLIQNRFGTGAATGLDAAKTALSDCNSQLGTWRSENPGGATTSQAQVALAGILDTCAQSLSH